MGIQDFAGKAYDKAKQIVTGNSAEANNLNSLTKEFKSALSKNSTLFGDAIKGDDWYKIYGYQFVVEIVKDPPKPTNTGIGLLDDVVDAAKSSLPQSDLRYFTLPIPPSSYNVAPVMASKATPTMGGVTEEVSEVKMWSISLEGTTGMAIVRQSGDEIDRQKMCRTFRDVITTTGALSGFLSQYNDLIAKAGGLADRVLTAGQNLFDDDMSAADKVASVTGSVNGAMSDMVAPANPITGSAVSDISNGFLEASELKRFLCMYHSLKGISPQKYNLYFVDQKSDQVWRVSIRNIAFSKNSQNPNLIRYQIAMTGWDSKPVSSLITTKGRKAVDRFGPGGDLKQVSVMGSAKNLDLLDGWAVRLRKGISR